MNQPSSKLETLIDNAFRKKEFEKLFCGIPPYIVISKYGGGHPNDLAVVHSWMAYYTKDLSSTQQHIFRAEVEKALQNILTKPSGCIYVAEMILFELVSSSRNTDLKLNLSLLTKLLKTQSKKYKSKLERMRDGYQWDNGAYGELESLSNKIEDFGGIGFL